MRRTCIFIFCFLLLNSANLRAQNHFSLTGNISAFSIDKVQSDTDVADVTYEGSSSVSLNLRLFNANHWALRFGVGADNVKFRVADQLNTDYDSERKDFIGIIGIEKHFPLSETVTLYPGFIVPLTLKGDESIKSNIDNSIAQLKDDGFFAGAGLVLGANIRFLKILRLGAEFEVTYENFKQTIWQPSTLTTASELKFLDYTTSFTIGLAF